MVKPNADWDIDYDLYYDTLDDMRAECYDALSDEEDDESDWGIKCAKEAYWDED